MTEAPNSGLRAEPAGATLLGLIAGATAVVIGVEVLATIGALRPIPLAVVGCLGLVFPFRAVFRHRSAIPIRRFATPVGAGLMVLGGVTLLTALLAPPNTWDSMTYHLPRIAHWLDQGSLWPWPTPIDREIWQPPFAEYLGLVTYGALGGRDWLVNLPQWLAGVGVVLVAAQTAETLGADSRGRWIAAWVAGTIPIAILEASSTQTDLLAALWIGIVTWLGLSAWRRRLGGLGGALTVGAALGLAVGTKGTGLPMALPGLLLFLIGRWRTHGARAALGEVAVALLVASGLNLPHWGRVLTASGTPFGPASVQAMLRPASLGPMVLLGNGLANLSLELGSTSATVNRLLEQATVGVHRLIGLEPAGLYPYFGGFRIVPWSTHEDQAGAPFHILLGAAGLIAVIVRRRRVASIQWAAIGGAVAAALAFTALVRWQPYNGRLHLALLVLAAPLIGLYLSRLPRWVGILALVALGLGAVLPALGNRTRPLVPGLSAGPAATPASILTASRGVTLFNGRPQLAAGYHEMAASLGTIGCQRVALFAGYDSWEYPLWALAGRGTSFVHREPASLGNPDPGGASSKGDPPTADDRPHRWCAVIAIDGPPDYGGPAGYRLERRNGGLSLWVPEEASEPTP